MELSERQLRPRHVVTGVVLALVVAVALLVGIGRLAGFSGLARGLREAEPAWVGVCLVGQVMVFAGYAGALRSAMASGAGAAVTVWLSVCLVLASFAATQVFAFAGVGGLAVMYWAFRRVGLDRDQAALHVIGLSAAVYLVFGAIGWAAAAAALVGGQAPLGMTIPWLIGMPLVLAAARWFTEAHRVERWTTSTDTVARRALATGVGAAAWVRGSIGTIDGRRLFLWAACYWVGDIISLWAGLRAYGAAPHVPSLTLAYTSGYLVQLLPIPLIGTGGLDAATTFLLHAVGTPLHLALLGILTHRVFAFWLPVIPGSVFALSLPRIGRSLGRLPRIDPLAPIDEGHLPAPTDGIDVLPARVSP
jgi:uncharacterized membrane protein YbhN (UPF0104 family)